jgi:glycosyltransferase involved in cell wall biosynthesis
VARGRRIPYVVSVHGGLFDVPADEAATWTEPTKGAWEWGRLLGAWVGSRRVFDDAAAILCVGREEQERTQREYPGKKVLHLPNGVDTARFAKGDGARFRERHGIPAGAPLVLVVGRIDPQKNQLGAVEALALLRESVPGARLLLLGHVTNDAYRGRVGKAVEERGLAGAVTLVPGVDPGTSDLVDAFHAADAFLLPSVHEPFGIVILEAWAAGLPVAASRVGGIPSFVEDGVDGLLLDPSDPRAAAEALGVLLADRDRARSLAEAGRRKATERYSWATVTEQLLGIYEEAIRENPLRH